MRNDHYCIFKYYFMGFEMTITIPIRSHLFKMINRTKETAPFTITMKDCVYSSIIYSALQKKYCAVQNRKKDVYNSELTIVIPAKYSLENRIYYDNQTLTFIDNSLRALFRERFLIYMSDNCIENGDIKKYIAKFMLSYDLTEEDILSETLTKLFWRKRNENVIDNSKNLRRKKVNQIKKKIPIEKVIKLPNQNPQQFKLFGS